MCAKAKHAQVLLLAKLLELVHLLGQGPAAHFASIRHGVYCEKEV